MPFLKGPRPGGMPSLGKSLQKAVPLRPAVNPRLAENRALRREAVRQVNNLAQPNRIRPVVRPAAPPLRVMPQIPRPAPVQKILPRGVPLAAGAGATAAGFLALNAAAAHATISSEAQSLQSSLSDLQQHSSFTDIVSDVTQIDTALQAAGELLDSARQKGYAFQADLESTLYDTLGQWESTRAQVLSIVQQQSNALQGQLSGVNPMIQNLNRVIGNPGMATSQLRSTQTYVNNLLQNVSRVETDLRNRYGSIQSQTQKLNAALKNIHWALDQLTQAKFGLKDGEDIVMAVTARWDQEGKDDPEGVLYLSNTRLVFERKEKVATKKVLFITTASELVQELLIDQPLSSLSGVKAENKGLFGHQDFLQIAFTSTLPLLNNVSMHLNGQDSKDWAAWVESARSGQIATNRVNAGAGLSVADLNKPLSQADILGLQSEVNALQDEVMLQGTRQELAELENDVHSLERKLADLRAHGYAIEKDLEADIAILVTQWERTKRNTETTIEYQSKVLGEQMAAVGAGLAQVVGASADLVAARPLFMQVKSSLASLQAQADAAETTVLTQYDEYADEVEALHAHLDWVKWMLDALSSASFRLLATESGVAAVEAVFQHPSWEPENGILYLTDQRVLWEDRVGDYELKVNVPIQEVLDVQKEASPAGDGEVLLFRFGPSGPLPEVHFHLALAVATDWIRMIGRARSGGYAEDRAVPLSSDELDRIRNAPQACQDCGAAFTAPVLRGQTEIPCEYCGKITRI